MDAKERKKKAEFHHQLIELLTAEPYDEEFYNKLLWGLEIIAIELNKFEK